MMKSRCFLLMALLAIVGNASADELVINDLGISQGETKTVSIELSNPTNDYIAFDFWMRLPDDVRIVYDPDGDLMASLNSSRQNGHILVVEEPQNNGVYHFVCYSAQNKHLKGNSGELVNITVKCAEDVVAGSYSGKVYGQIFSDPNKKEVDLDDVTFGVTIADSAMSGDANGDGSVSVADAVAVVNYLLNNGSTDNNFVFEAADIDGSGTITAADAHGIVSIILNQ